MYFVNQSILNYDFDRICCRFFFSHKHVSLFIKYYPSSMNKLITKSKKIKMDINVLDWNTYTYCTNKHKKNKIIKRRKTSWWKHFLNIHIMFSRDEIFYGLLLNLINKLSRITIFDWHNGNYVWYGW